MTDTTTPDTSILAKVRALLAKAESTEYPDEADAFNAKAVQLMQRHAIEMAHLAGADTAELATTELWVPEPYSKAKAHLAWAIDDHVGVFVTMRSSISTIGGQRGRKVFVTGTAHARELFEALFTSLLSQCSTRVVKITKATLTAEFLAENPDAPSWQIEAKVASTRTARDQFIVGFAYGVDAQLRKAAEPGAGLVLASEQSRAEAWYCTGRKVTTTSGKYGSAAGRAAGATADVGRSRVGGGVRALGR